MFSQEEYKKEQGWMLFSLLILMAVLLLLWKVLSKNKTNNVIKVLIVFSGVVFVVYQVNDYAGEQAQSVQSLAHTEATLDLLSLMSKIELNDKLTSRKIDKQNVKISMLLNRIDYLNEKIDSHIGVVSGQQTLKHDTIQGSSKSVDIVSAKEENSISESQDNDMKKLIKQISEKHQLHKRSLLLPLPEQPVIADTSYSIKRSFIIDPETKRQRFINLPTVGGITGQHAFDWAKHNVPFIDLPDLPEIEKAYYYRWKVYREHLVETGCVGAPIAVTECRFATTPPPDQTVDHNRMRLPIDGSEGCIWGDENGVIGAANGHHIMEGRWLRNDKITQSYISYLLHYDIKSGTTPEGSCSNTSTGFTMMSKKKKGSKRTGRRVYSEWLIFSIYNKYLIDGNIEVIRELIPLLIEDLKKMVSKSRADLCRSKSCQESVPGVPKCYWTTDLFDAMEGSVSGAGCRPSLHAIAYGETRALAFLLNEVAESLSLTPSDKEKEYNDIVIEGQIQTKEMLILQAKEYLKQAEEIRSSFEEHLWNEKLQFFTTLKTVEKCEQKIPVVSNDSLSSSNHKLFLRENQSENPSIPPPLASPCQWHGVQFPCDELVDVRELIGLGPAWMYGLIQPNDQSPRYEVGWAMLQNKEDGFKGKYGLRTTELRHRCYNFTGTGRCEWNGPSWPYETSRALTGLGELLQPLPSGGFSDKPYSDKQRKLSGLTNKDFVELLDQYAKQHTQAQYFHEMDAWNSTHYLVSENFHADDGYWIDRYMAHNKATRNAGLFNSDYMRKDRNRGVDYLHSTFCDIVLSHLFGIKFNAPSQSKPSSSSSSSFSSLIVSPLLIGVELGGRNGQPSRFAVDRLRVRRGIELGIIYDPEGNYYFSQAAAGETKKKPLCKGFCVFVNEKLSASAASLEPLDVQLL